MRTFRNIICVVMLMFGCVWLLQGLNVLPGSFMSGQTRWAVWGGVLICAAVAGLIWTNRKRAPGPQARR